MDDAGSEPRHAAGEVALDQDYPAGAGMQRLVQAVSLVRIPGVNRLTAGATTTRLLVVPINDDIELGARQLINDPVYDECFWNDGKTSDVFHFLPYRLLGLAKHLEPARQPAPYRELRSRDG